MVDKALFVDASGAKNAMHQLTVITNNLANTNTVGFRADYEVSQDDPVQGKDPTRIYSKSAKTYTNFDQGPIMNTSRDLDVAISGNGFFAVQSKTGAEGYTRAGDFEITKGLLTTKSGKLVLGENGVINIPDTATRVNIGNDGGISIQISGQSDMVTIGHLKLVNPPLAQLQKGADGLLYNNTGSSSPISRDVKLVPKALEGSNVSAVESLTQLIDMSRQFEFHTNLIKNLQQISGAANQLLEVPRA